MMFKSLAAIAAALFVSAAYANPMSRSSNGASAPGAQASSASERMAQSTAADAADARAANGGGVPASCIPLMGNERKQCLGRFGAISGRR